MKRLVLLNCLLFSAFFYTFNTACIIENIPAKPQTFASPYPSSNFSTKKQYDDKGFCGNTLVQTPYGYKPIKNLVKDDFVIDCNGQEKRIVAITKKYVDQYVKIVVDNTTIYSGCGQCYYVFPVSIWFLAKRIWTGAKLFNNKSELCEVMHVELIHKKALLYCLTVEDHTFSIAPNGLCAHNAEAFIFATSSMCLGYVITVNPIVATVGAAVALSVVAHKAYQTYMKQCSSDNVQKVVPPTDVVLAERSYYVQRTAALETIKQELLYIKNGLEHIKFFCGVDSASFTYQFLKQTNIENVYNQNQLLKISTANEMKLSDKQKENLRTLREINLQRLEQEIINLQSIFALHADELIKQIDVARDEYKKVQEQISNAIALWNDNLSNMTYAIALQSYKANLLEEHLLNNLNQKLNELKIVAQYYTNCVNTMCIEQSTNIIQLLEKLVPVSTECDQWVVTEKSRVAENINVVEKHFVCRGVSVPHLKNGIKNELAKGRNDRNVQAVAEAKNKLASIAVFGGPNKNNKKNDDEDKGHPFGKYEDAAYHTKISNSVKSKAPSNGQLALDNSISIGKNTSRRIGISDGEIVILDQTAPGLFHGHVRAWSDLTQVMKNVLTEANLVTLKGKIK